MNSGREFSPETGHHGQASGLPESKPQRAAEIAAKREWYAQIGEHFRKRGFHPSDPYCKVTEADILVGRGEDEAALKLYLWFFDTGFRLKPSYEGVRASYVLHRILVLGGKIGYQPALTALRERRDACEARLKTGQGTRAEALDYENLNARFRQQSRTMAMFELLQPGTPAWQALGDSLLDSFLENRRYTEILKLFNPETTFENWLSSIRSNDCSGLKPHLNKLLLKKCGPIVEALAGSGQHERALTLAKQIMGAIPGRVVRKQLIEHAQRSGDMQLAGELAAPRGKRQ